AKSLSRVARPARGALRTRCVLVQYVEGSRGEPAGRRLVVAADRRLQQKRSRIMRTRCNRELTLPTLTGQGPFIMVSSRMLKKGQGGWDDTLARATRDLRR